MAYRALTFCFLFSVAKFRRATIMDREIHGTFDSAFLPPEKPPLPNEIARSSVSSLHVSGRDSSTLSLC